MLLEVHLLKQMSTLKEECEREKITADEVIFYKFRSKKSAWINIFVLDLVL